MTKSESREIFKARIVAPTMPELAAMALATVHRSARRADTKAACELALTECGLWHYVTERNGAIVPR